MFNWRSEPVKDKDEKALDCKDAIDELRETESELYKQRFDNIATEYDGILGIIEHEKNMLDEYINQTELHGYIVSTEYYKALKTNEQKTLDKLKKEKSSLLSSLNSAVKSGTIKKNSEAWVEMMSKINEVTEAIEEGNSALLEYNNSIREIEWSIFDLLQERISQITTEADFLIDLMENKKLYDDRGQLTDKGMSTMGLHGVNYNIYMAQADKYRDEMLKINKQLAKDPNNQELANRKQELIELQQESILNAEDEKNAIKDMVEEGIELELDALQELIDKREEALDSQKDLYDYQKKVAEQTKEIASLEKQMSAYAGDNSEETKAKIQELKVSLEEAKDDLEESEYDKYISDQSALMDELYLEYETILNARLDNIDALLSDMIIEINNNADTIGTTLSQKADDVGYMLSDSMKSIWDTGTADIKNVVTVYGDKFNLALTTVNSTLGLISKNVQNMITQLNKLAKTNIKAAGTSSSSNSSKSTTKPKSTTNNTKTKQSSKSTKKSISVGGKIDAGNARIYATSKGTGGGTQYYKNDPIYVVLSEKNGYLLVRHHKLSSGYTGWFRKKDVKAYATGNKKLLENEIAWTQENGAEMIIRPSDGAVLTPLAKGDSVLNAGASNNIWEMANSPADFIRDNLGIDKVDTSVDRMNNATYTQNLDKVIFNLPNVKNYSELLNEMQRDKNFERLILSMTVDRIAGRTSLGKGKAIR